MKSVLMWSGGVESTSCLKYLLTETNDLVIACHLSLRNQEGRWENEALAISELLETMQRLRPFQFHYSFMNIQPVFPLDFEVIFTHAHWFKQHFRADRIIRGTCLEDANTNPIGPGARPEDIYHVKAGCIMGMDSNWRTSIPYLPMYSWPKKQHMEYLGNLLPLTWSCRRPVNHQPCGTCHSCKERRV